MDVFKLRDKVIGDYGDYVTSFIEVSDQRIRAFVSEQMSQGALWPEPLLQLNPAFEPGESISDLVAQGVLHQECAKVFRDKKADGSDKGPLRFHKHQVEGIRAARAGLNYVLTTGTGSGKSLAYIVPIVDHVLRRGSGKGIQAIVVYPMNALANSQLGELEKFLNFGYPKDHPPVTFRRYTGQESSDERREIIANPPDILLTNYVMLELLLTRVHERELIRAATGLRFIVLDELHTYRGRQGADVAMLVRRVREACGAKELLHVGTSATMSGSAEWSAQQQDVADVASRIFGATVKPEAVIGETLRRVTPEREPEPGFAAELRGAIERGELPPLTSPSAFASHPLPIWIESTLGLRTVNGRLVRCPSIPLAGTEGASAALARAVNLPLEQCERALRRSLLAGYQVKDEQGRPVFAFRLHQFVSKGDAVYASPEPEDVRHLTLKAQQFVPNSDRKRILLPVAFCRECGKEYYLVRRVRDAQGRTMYLPRDLGDRSADDASEVGFLHIDTATPWPEAGENVLARLPDPWLELDRHGQRRVRDSRRHDVPVTVAISPDGIEGAGNIRAQWMGAPFRFCLSCSVAYSAHRASDFGKLATLGSEGRSTATTVMTLSAVRGLRKDEDLQDTARKLLSFTDNRQDASLQAGHFNDFVEITQLRAGLWRAVHASGQGGIRHDQLMKRVFDALALGLELYAANPAVEFAQRDDTNRALRSVLGYYVYRDLKRGWRITSPNLEQCGLLDLDFLSLEEFCKSDKHWAKRHDVLAAANPAERERACRVLLDFMRRELAIKVEFLDPVDQEAIQQQSRQYLVAPWAIDDQQELERSAIVLPGSRLAEHGDDRLVYLSARGGFGSYLRSRSAFGSLDGPPITVQQSGEIIQDLLEALIIPGIVSRALEPRDERPAGYQINASALIWREGEGARAFHDPVRVPNAPAEGLRPNPFFKAFYRADTSDLRAMEAREHTAQVPGAVREEREERFRRAALPLLFCSPTMELGVDIASLNVVNMRNVPPTPANYAQRSGRAGRSGQPAFVFTYCSAGSPHDQYFFRFPEKMVSGSVTTPRLDLANEDLVRAHVHAIWLGVARIDLKQSLAEVLDVSGDTPSLALLPVIREALEEPRHRSEAARIATSALAAPIESLLAPGETTEGWLHRVLDQLPRSFDEACQRWRGLYRSALSQSKRQQRIVLDASRDRRDRDRASRLRAEAEAQLRLLLEVSEEAHSDFYSYRYFASEGFLPGYNFPRLPLSAFLPGSRARTSHDEFLTRPRFLAISEFGPRTILYHEGSRYQVNKVILPVDADGQSVTRRASQCEECGYLHPIGDEPAPDLCEHCGKKLPPVHDNLFRMQNVSTRRRDRINSDEEERFRLGFELKTGVRFAHRAGVLSAQQAAVLSESGEPLATLVYGNSATLWRINLGERRRKNQNLAGFMLDVERGYWATDSTNPDDPPEETSQRLQRVVPYVEDRRNCLLLTPASPLPLAVMASLQAALKAAVQVQFQLEDRELAAEPLPSEADRRSILLYESSEGGAGVLRRLVEDPKALGAVARRALELAHFDPSTLADLRRAPRAKEDCEAACYDCLLSYFNQRDHRYLDRQVLPAILGAWTKSSLRISPRAAPREDHVARLLRLAQSDLERRWVMLLDGLGLKLPSDAQTLVSECGVRLDFVYGQENLAVFIDGPHHDAAAQQAVDRRQQDSLEDFGFTVLRFHHAADWREILARHAGIFGQLPATPDPAVSSPAEGTIDLDLFDQAWHPLVAKLAELTDLTVEPGGDLSDLAGRVIGFAHARVTKGGQALDLLDAGEATTGDVLAAVRAAGGKALPVTPSDPTAVQAILDALRG